jgi:hypothetical protein
MGAHFIEHLAVLLAKLAGGFVFVRWRVTLFIGGNDHDVGAFLLR